MDNNPIYRIHTWVREQIHQEVRGRSWDFDAADQPGEIQRRERLDALAAAMDIIDESRWAHQREQGYYAEREGVEV